MAKLEGAGPGDISRKQVLKTRRRARVYHRRGAVYIAKWPRRRGKVKSARQQAWVDRFSCFARAFSSPDPDTLNAANFWAKNVDIATAQGVSPSGWFYRDVITRAAVGKLITYQREVKIITPTAKVTRLSNQQFTAAQTAAMIPTAMEWDNNNFWNPNVNPTRLTVRAPGLYLVGATVYAVTSSSGYQRLTILRNGTDLQCGNNAQHNAANWYTEVMGLVYCHANDYLEAIVLNSVSVLQYQLPSFWMVAITPEQLVP